MSEPLQFEGHQPSDPVSLVVRRRIRPGQEAAYETLLAEANALLARLPGHRGTGVIRPCRASRSTRCSPASTR